MIPLLPNKIYHIYNHAIGDDDLFRNDENYSYFLKRYAFFIHPIAKTYAYCLMANHFHILVKIRSEEELITAFAKLKTYTNLGGFQNLQDLEWQHNVSKQFSNLFNSYTKSLNKYFNRTGGLFCQNFKRKQIENDMYFKSVVQYIHHNPVRHGFCSSVEDWKWSSYHAFLSDKPTLLQKQDVMEYYGNQSKFVESHKNIPYNYTELADNDFY